ncbi:MAG: MMPL family transporter [Sporichthyaceae bacterium]|nr:MMPL family transporter [Sporichthyaceae bacterium]
MRVKERIAALPAGRRAKWLVVIFWVGLVVVALPLAGRLGDVQQNSFESWVPGSAESTKAFKLAEQSFGEGDTIPTIIVYARDGGLTAADRTKLEADHARVAPYAKGGQLPPVIYAQDQAAAMISLPLAGSMDGEGEVAAKVEQLKDVVQANAPPGLQVKVTGAGGSIADFGEVFSGIDSTLLLVTFGAVALILIITYRSPLLWLVPLFTVFVGGAQVANAVVYLLAKYAGLVVNGQSAGILTVLVIGAGTDYALLLIARYREELRRHADRHEAMAIAMSRSWPAILASAGTVILGMLCLLVAEMNSTQSLGPVAAVGIGVAFLVMTTLLPALLVILGRWLFWPFVPRFDAAHAEDDPVTDHGLWGRISRFVGRHSRPVWIGTVVALIALTFGTLTMRTGLRQSEAFTSKPESVVGQELLAAHFAAGAAEPVQVYARAATAPEVAQAVAEVPGVAPGGVAQTVVSGDWAQIDAVLGDAADSPQARETVGLIRDTVHAIPGADALVGGTTAFTVDADAATARDLRVVIPLILVVVLLILTVLLRALVGPLVLLGSVVLSFGAALGAAALLFNALGYPRVDKGLPLFGFLFLVALGIDYTIFLMTRAREEVARVGHRQGVLRALAVTGGVITSAGIVLAATFAGLGSLPVVFILHIGLLVAVGVLLDTLVVRSFLVPALALDIGRRFWSPGRLGPRPAGPPLPGQPDHAAPEVSDEERKWAPIG